jgi:hypothetical protein
LVAVSVCAGLVVPTVTGPKESGPLSWSVGWLESSNDDCASAGCAKAPRRNNSVKVRAAIDRV